MRYGTSATYVLLEPDRLGRGAEWTVVRETVVNGAERGRGLWLRGEPGVGKTVLLEQTGRYAAAQGMRVLNVSGAEAERNLPFAALHQLRWSLWEHVDEISGPGRAVLYRALEMGDAEPAPSYTVSAATLELLVAVARRQPLLIAIDGMHWLDASSAEVLHFLQLRLAAVPLVMVATLREGALSGRDTSGVRVLDVRPLREGAEALLTERHPGAPAMTRTRILREAAGNPLALVELPSQLGAPERYGQPPLPDHLPLGERLERAFAHRAEALGPAVRAETRDLLDATAARLLAAPSMELIRAAIAAEPDTPSLAVGTLHETLGLRILEYMRTHLAERDLTPARVAAAHHISVRHLYSVLARSGVGFGEWVGTQRLDACRRELSDRPRAFERVGRSCVRPRGRDELLP
ncbi:AAA family ATPase [Streptomyces sp. NPDC002573]|uniref:AAA family ATPase n=1 Tax=Streptomyces sp. NPDC002573 TaxID=3364651 RepID=UPI003683C402